jgi:hypothetical protein
VGPRASLDSEKSRPNGIRSPDRPARCSVAIPIELPGPLENYIIVLNLHYKMRYTKTTYNKNSIKTNTQNQVTFIMRSEQQCWNLHFVNK